MILCKRLKEIEKLKTSSAPPTSCRTQSIFTPSLAGKALWNNHQAMTRDGIKQHSQKTLRTPLGAEKHLQPIDCKENHWPIWWDFSRYLQKINFRTHVLRKTAKSWVIEARTVYPPVLLHQLPHQLSQVLCNQLPQRKVTSPVPTNVITVSRPKAAALLLTTLQHTQIRLNSLISINKGN